MIADIVFSRAAAAVLAAVPAVLRLAITMTVAVISASTITVIVVFVVIADAFMSPSLKTTTTKQNLLKLAALAVLAKLK